MKARLAAKSLETEVPPSAIVASPSHKQRLRTTSLLGEIGMVVKAAADLADAERLIRAHTPALAILQGFAVDDALLSFCRAARYEPLSTIVVAPSPALIDRVIVLELGADEVLCEPADDRLLMSRLKAVMRRTGGGAVLERRLAPSGWTTDLLSRTAVSPAGRQVQLTAAELSLLDLFIRNRGKVIDAGFACPRLGTAGGVAFRCLISRLRRKLESISAGANPIKSLRGLGYTFND